MDNNYFFNKKQYIYDDNTEYDTLNKEECLLPLTQYDYNRIDAVVNGVKKELKLNYDNSFDELTLQKKVANEIISLGFDTFNISEMIQKISKILQKDKTFNKQEPTRSWDQVREILARNNPNFYAVIPLDIWNKLDVTMPLDIWNKLDVTTNATKLDYTIVNKFDTAIRYKMSTLKDVNPCIHAILITELSDMRENNE